MAYLKNIASSEVLKLADQVQYATGQVVSKTLVQNKGVGITLFAFAKGEGISEHESTGDAFVTCLDGKGKIMIDGKPYLLEKGESIVMPDFSQVCERSSQWCELRYSQVQTAH